MVTTWPMTRRGLLGLGIVGLLAAGSGDAAAADPLKVVASFSILGDLVQQVGGDRVVVTTLVGPDGDAHVYQPAPADALAVAGADVVVVNGLGFEGWIDRLVEAAGYQGRVVLAAARVTPRKMPEEDHHPDETPGHADDHDHGGHDHDHDRDHLHDGDHPHDHGEIDPHAWQSVANVKLYVAAIKDGLTAVDRAGAATYQANAAGYLAELDALDTEIKAAIAAIPAERRKIVTSHDAFGYFAGAYGVTFLAPVGVNTEAEASAAEVAGLIRQIKAERIRAVFLENISDPRLLEQIVRETGAAIGGTLFSDALSRPDGAAASYLAMMRHNTRTIAAALGHGG